MRTLVGRHAPDFTAPAVIGDGEIIDHLHFDEVRQNRHVYLFFYPMDFTFVCPSELIALHNRLDEFTARNVEVIAVSVDSQFTHYAWRNTPIEQGGIGPVRFTMVADVNHRICRAYGVELAVLGVALRASFLIDPLGTVRHAVVNDLPLGRNIDEMLRMVDALQFHEIHGEVCPAGWQKGQPAMVETARGVSDYMAVHAKRL